MRREPRTKRPTQSGPISNTPTVPRDRGGDKADAAADPCAAEVGPPLLLAFAGGSGAGKSTLARGVVEAVGGGRVVVVAEDAYYFDNGGRPGVDPALVDFDDPAAKDLALLARHMRALRRGAAVAAPTYCFARHRRLAETVEVRPAPLVIVEGLHVLAEPRLAALFDLRVYVDAPEAVRFDRRLARDVGERGRTRESVELQFATQVVPAHRRFIAPTRARADLLIENGAGPLAAALAPILEAVARARPGLVAGPLSRPS